MYYNACVSNTVFHSGTLVAMMPVLLTDMFGPKHISNLMSYGCATLAVVNVAGQPFLGSSSSKSLLYVTFRHKGLSSDIIIR